jgi:hypothetical protein
MQHRCSTGGSPDSTSKRAYAALVVLCCCWWTAVGADLRYSD